MDDIEQGLICGCNWSYSRNIAVLIEQVLDTNCKININQRAIDVFNTDRSYQHKKL